MAARFWLRAASGLCTLMLASVLALPAAAMPGNSGGGAPQPSGNWPSSSPGQKSKPSEYKDALKLIEDGKCAEALPLLQKAADKSPKDPDIYNQMGFCQRGLGQYQESFDNYRKALTLDPNHKGARNYVGVLFLLLNRPDDAQAQLDQLAKLCPRGCPERDGLAKEIEDYKAKQAGAPSAN